METNKEKQSKTLSKNYNLLEELSIYIKIQNIQLLKLIANNEKWNFKELLHYLK